MKVCPVCNAESFKDMEVCFGCMHRFGEPEEADFERRGEPAGEDVAGGSEADALARGGDRSFRADDGKAPDGDAVPPVGVEAVVLPVSGGAYNLVISFQPVQS